MSFQTDVVNAIRNNDCTKMEDLIKVKLKSCINKPMKVRTDDYDGVMSPLCLAVMEGDHSDTTIVQLLLKHGANPRKHRDWRIPSISPMLTEFMSPVFMAIRKQNLPVLQLLLEAGADVNETAPGLRVQEEEGGSMLYRDSLETCLHRAVYMRNAAMVDLLISKGAKVKALNRDDQTPLHCCGDNYDKEVFKHLIHGGALAHNLDREGQSVLSYLLKPLLYDDGVEAWEEDDINQRIESIHLLVSAGYNVYKDHHLRCLIDETSHNPHVNGVCQNAEFMSFIKHRLCNAPSLDFLCCVAIRRHLGTQCCQTVVDQLPLPQKFKDYIMLNSYWK